MQGSEERDLMDLVRTARDGDRAACSVLVTAVLPRVRSMVHQRLERSYRRHNDWIVGLFSTGDVVQDLLIGALADLARFRGDDESNLMAWLATQVEHRILERLRFFRSRKRDQRRVTSLDESRAGGGAAGIADPGPSPSTSAEAADLWAAVQNAMASMTDDERAVLECTLDPELSWEEVARTLGLPSAESARQRHKRARARLSLRLATRFPQLFGGRATEGDDEP